PQIMTPALMMLGKIATPAASFSRLTGIPFSGMVLACSITSMAEPTMTASRPAARAESAENITRARAAGTSRTSALLILNRLLSPLPREGRGRADDVGNAPHADPARGASASKERPPTQGYPPSARALVESHSASKDADRLEPAPSRLGRMEGRRLVVVYFGVRRGAPHSKVHHALRLPSFPVRCSESRSRPPRQ